MVAQDSSSVWSQLVPLRAAADTQTTALGGTVLSGPGEHPA